MNNFDFNAIFDNTESTMILAKLTVLPEPKNGKESVKFEVGQMMESLSTDTMKEGSKFKIESFNVVNGYVRYFGAGMWHRQKDIKIYEGE